MGRRLPVVITGIATGLALFSLALSARQIKGETSAPIAIATGTKATQRCGFGPRWVHEAVHEGLLRSHGALAECEFYLCGPPAMLKATRELLAEIGVAPDRVAFDDFDA